MTKLEMVKEFRRAFSLPISDVPCVPGADSLELHHKLIRDESGEIEDAESVTDVLDVIVDLQYFILGLAAESGIAEEQIADWFKKVHAANMQKLWTDQQVEEKFGVKINWCWTFDQEFERTLQDGIWQAKSNATTNEWVVRLNGKVQKPPGWTAAELQ